VKKLYMNAIKNNLFVKIMLIFAVIIVFATAILAYFTIDYIGNSAASSELEKQKAAMSRVNQFIEGKANSVQHDVQQIYRDQSVSYSISYLLKNSFADYMNYKIDTYYSNGSNGANDLDLFRKMLDNDHDIANVLLFSSEKQFLYMFGQTNVFKLYQTKAARSYVPDAMALEGGIVSIPNTWVRKTINQQEEKLFSVRSNINDVGTLKNVGQLLVFFHSDAILGAMQSENGNMLGYILVLSAEGKVIFDSSERYYGKTYPYEKQIQSLEEEQLLEEKSLVSTLTSSSLGYTVLGILPQEDIFAIYQPMRDTIIVLSAAFIVIAISIPSFVVINFSRRTNRIIRSMRRVETGDMTIRIQDGKGDEIGQLSQGFNRMLDELTLHIDRVYVAELKQKHTEFAALQARINPHFLYNTLEVIRMRAISHGAEDVSEMIYSLAVLFKSFVQQQTVVTLREEFENCRLYLELFRIRYRDSFSYEIECAQELEHSMMVKLSLQPIVENYIVHGMRPECEDNHIRIAASLEDSMITVTVHDNGVGIEKARLAEIQRSLSRTGQQQEDSLGLRSVKERLDLIYGKRCFFHIESTFGEGTKVVFSFPAMQKGEMDDVSRVSG
jgi:two-component system sensor histidine kinase YesM